MSSMRMYRERMFNENPVCFVCKGHIESVEDCNIEHIIPRSKGGPNTVSNYAISHIECNSKRSDSLLVNNSPKEYIRLLNSLKNIIKGQEKQIKTLSDAIKIKNTNVHRLSVENDFMRKRVKACFGYEGYLKVMNHVDCPGGFDAENYKKVNKLEAVL